jgi:hypothetical protein
MICLVMTALALLVSAPCVEQHGVFIACRVCAALAVLLCTPAACSVVNWYLQPRFIYAMGLNHVLAPQYLIDAWSC